MFEKILKNKLTQLGYDTYVIDEKLRDFDFEILDKTYQTDEEINNDIEFIQYEEPTVEIARCFLSTKEDIIVKTAIEGEMLSSSIEVPTGHKMTIINYDLSKNICIVALYNDLKLKILYYNPSIGVKTKYKDKMYEDCFAEERNSIAKEYIEALSDGGKVTPRVGREIVYTLLSEYVIDKMIVDNLNPRLKLYELPDKYAENITAYKIKYINKKVNKIEIAQKDIYLRELGKGVTEGYITNDSYAKLDSVNNVANFSLNKISYYWLYSNDRGKEEISVYIASRKYEQIDYKELYSSDDKKIEKLSFELTQKFSYNVGYDISNEYVKDVLKRLNMELLVPSMDIIEKYSKISLDEIEPLRYKFKVISDPEEYEKDLYLAIEDNMGRRYKFRISESVMEDYTIIGNKLDYTGTDGKTVRKQSIADFDMNSNSVVIVRETFIDANNIQGLLGYIYEDVEHFGTSNLPVPNMEVIFYFPEPNNVIDEVRMFNGTDIGYAESHNKKKKFYSDDGEIIGKSRSGIEKREGTTTVNVKYKNSLGEVLKENVIYDLYPGTTFVPETLPIINDKDGKEWIYDQTQMPSLVLKKDDNSIEVKYLQKMTSVIVAYINKQGKKLKEDLKRNVQVGSTFDIKSEDKIKDKDGEEWSYQYSLPKKLVISENLEKNRITLVYDMIKAPVKLIYQNKLGDELIPPKEVIAVANKKYDAHIDENIVDESGLSWCYISDKPSSIIVDEKKENKIILVYDELKAKVITSFINDDGEKIRDDLLEFIQVGKEYISKFENTLYDYEDKKWEYVSIDKKSFKVSQKESENLIKVIYKKSLANITVRFNKESGQRLKDDLRENVQVGSRYTSSVAGDIEDASGLLWSPISKNEEVIVSENENKNLITIMYERAMSKVTVKFFDDERNSIIPDKVEILQVGERYKPTVINKVEDNFGKRWQISDDEVKEITVKKFEEENINSIYYEKVLTKVTLNFIDAYGKQLKAIEEVDAQIGSEYKAEMFVKITDYENVRWMLETSEPQKMVVKEKDNNFDLIYGEVKSLVLVRCVDILTQEKIVEDITTKVKLGGIYIPNIIQKVLDKHKRQWKYVGEKDISIATKENEQENIIILNYEADKVKVIVRYEDMNEARVKDDIVQELQIGSEIQIKEIPKLTDKNGLMWKLNSMTNSKLKISEDSDKNVITSKYDPLCASVIIKYLNTSGKEIIKSKSEEVQVGKKYSANMEEKIISNDGYLWRFKNTNQKEIIIEESENMVALTYEPLISNVTLLFVDEEDRRICDDEILKIQAGTIFKFQKPERLIDKEGKYWLQKVIDRSEIKVSENFDANKIIISYKKELTDVRLIYKNELNNFVKDDNKVRVQIGEKYKPEILEIVIDKNEMGWMYSKSNPEFYQIKEKAEENVFEILYEPKIVKIYEKYYNSDEKEELRDPNIVEKQVGIKYTTEIPQIIDDREGREWLSIGKSEIKIFASSTKSDLLKVNLDESKNVLKFRYKPSMVPIIIRYEDTLGNTIRRQEMVDAQKGSVYEAKSIERIVDNKGNKWTFNPKCKASLKVTGDDKDDIIVLAYEEEKATITFLYKDEAGNELILPKKVLAQIGSTYVPEFDKIIEDQNHLIWEYKSRDVKELDVKENEKDNIINLLFAPLMIDVVLSFIDLKDRNIIDDKKVKAQLGSNFKPNIENNITNKNSYIYKFKKCEPEIINVKEIPIGAEKNPNRFKLTYEPLYSDVTIIYQDFDGNKLKDDLIEQLQVGDTYILKPIQYIKDKKENQWGLVNSEAITIIVKENPKENIIKQVYEVAKTEVIVRYRDPDGNSLKPDEKFAEQIGNDFIPVTPKELIDNKGRKWNFFNVDPVQLKVASINNIITLTYEEAKSQVIIKLQDESGKKLKDDEKELVQIGSRFSPKVKSKVIYDANDIWRYLRSDPQEIVVSENSKENTIILVYGFGDKASIENELKEETVDENAEKIKKILQEESKLKQNENEEQIEELPKEEINQEESVSEETFEFADENLKRLSKSLSMKEDEKKAVNILNDYNTDTIKILHNCINDYDENALKNIDEIMKKEKEIIQSGLEGIILSDKTGNKLLKIFEHITSSEADDKVLYTLQQKKAILVADYFLNKQVTDIEGATYICERGKNDKSYEIINRQISNPKLVDELKKVRVIVMYEKALLDNYYKARNEAKDNYFKDEMSRNLLKPEVVIAVTNMLTKQAYNIITKKMLETTQRVELESIILLLTDSQRITLETMISNITDSKQRKEAQKLYKELNK